MFILYNDNSYIFFLSALFPSRCILVENQGRVNVIQLFDPKGIVPPANAHAVAINSVPVLGSWLAYKLPLKAKNVEALATLSSNSHSSNNSRFPAFYTFSLEVSGSSSAGDTWISTRSFKKGVVFVNGRNLGRYWEERSSQHSLYVPACFLKPGQNSIVVFETEGTATSFDGTLITRDHSDFDGAPATTSILLML